MVVRDMGSDELPVMRDDAQPEWVVTHPIRHYHTCTESADQQPESIVMRGRGDTSRRQSQNEQWGGKGASPEGVSRRDSSEESVPRSQILHGSGSCHTMHCHSGTALWSEPQALMPVFQRHLTASKDSLSVTHTHWHTCTVMASTHTASTATAQPPPSTRP